MVVEALIQLAAIALCFGLGHVFGTVVLSKLGSVSGTLLQIVLFCAVCVATVWLTGALLSAVNAPRYSQDADSAIGVVVTLAENAGEATKHVFPSLITGFLAAIAFVIAAHRAWGRKARAATEREVS